MTEIAAILTPGHPAGCSCGECGCRRMHIEGAHENDQCTHGTCLVCTGCAECEEREREEQNARYSDELVARLAGKVAEALAAAYQAGGVVRELSSNQVYDIELAEGVAGADLFAELEDATRHLRNAERIVKWRMDLFKEDEQPSLEEERENAAQATWAAGTMLS